MKGVKSIDSTNWASGVKGFRYYREFDEKTLVFDKNCQLVEQAD